MKWIGEKRHTVSENRKKPSSRISQCIESKHVENEGFLKKVIVPKINRNYFLKVGTIKRIRLKTYEKKYLLRCLLFFDILSVKKYFSGFLTKFSRK